MPSRDPFADAEVVLAVEDLEKHFPVIGGVFKTVQDHVRAVDDVSFTIRKGETLGVVGESGCGKTTLGRAILHLTEPTSGSVTFQGRDITDPDRKTERWLRRRMQMVFQDPASSLNPRMTVHQIVGEPLKINDVVKGEELTARVKELLDVVGLKGEHVHRYPHEFSGGQKQRIGVARALALNPDFLLLDEPTSALDVSVQAQVLNLLEDLQGEFDLTYLFITHELNVVNHISDRVAVMYLGRLVELAPTEDLFGAPLHPYTRALLSAIPDPDPTVDRERILLEGDVPSPVDPPSGCRFHPRCPIAERICGWSGDELAERLEGARDQGLDGMRREIDAVLGPPSRWETTRSTFTVPLPDDPGRAKQLVRNVLSTETEEFGEWFHVDEDPEEGTFTVDFEPRLVPQGGTETQPGPSDAARQAGRDHMAACFFAGKEIPLEVRQRIRARIHGEELAEGDA